MSRAIVLVLDSLGIGASADAARYGDAGANTLGHIALACARGEADERPDGGGPLRIPNLCRLGLGHALAASSGVGLLQPEAEPAAAWGYARELSRGKDTPSGHWEIAGVPVPFEWGFFPPGPPSFPDDLVDTLIRRAELAGILGNCHASGTAIIAELGEEHIRTGKPICYTSADSVFQIAAHEEHFGLQRLYDLCALAKELVEPLNITRVIARPFVGEHAGNFRRTANRRDLTTPPIGETLLDRLVAQGRTVVSVGKISDIFAGRGISHTVKGEDNNALFDRLLEETAAVCEGSLVFANFVDFDMQYGHRRDVAGYAAALEAFDRRLPELEALLGPGDLALITADHGCDPTWPGSDHTREHVPVLFFGPAAPVMRLGARESFADMGQTLAAHLDAGRLNSGQRCF